MPKGQRTNAIKRLFDIAISVAALIVLSVSMLAIAAWIRLTLGRPVFYRQRRPGLGGKPFTILKFRTMTDACDVKGNLLPDGKRLKRVGIFMRSSSLDELPELINVLKGDMSLVGPRPLLMQYMTRYNTEQNRRHEVKPGVTGWAQVNGRNALNWEEKFRLDVLYVDNRSFALDFKILWMTLFKVFTRKGISADGHATMPEFLGSRPTQE